MDILLIILQWYLTSGYTSLYWEADFKEMLQLLSIPLFTVDHISRLAFLLSCCSSSADFCDGHTNRVTNYLVQWCCNHLHSSMDFLGIFDYLHNVSSFVNMIFSRFITVQLLAHANLSLLLACSCVAISWLGSPFYLST
ncbi:unnamed protein product [Cuscuta campestris]|uniref:Uncharacterized protein n=1 Tax=Cuscuta campestris TaxID=132261 RepID=A0A484LAC7_9ASTE|nr:unnamed protein product [Cuscuta campestris]